MHDQDLIAELRELARHWRADAVEDIPADYVRRGLGQKYLNGDNNAAGMNDCADDLSLLLDEHNVGD